MDKQDFIKWAQKLESEYSASDATKARLSQVDLVAIVGPTGVGKSTIINKLGLPYVRSDVSRAQRPEEKNGADYNFREDLLDVIQEIKDGEYAQFLVSKYGEFYGTKGSSYPEAGPCTMAIIAGAMPLFRSLGFRSVTAFYIMPPSYVEWMRRIGSVRSVEILPRIDEARQSITLAANSPSEYNFILNDDLELAIKDIKSVLTNTDINEHRMQLALDTADIILERIGDNI